jgi:very-short-patch-repair endonuclease
VSFVDTNILVYSTAAGAPFQDRARAALARPTILNYSSRALNLRCAKIRDVPMIPEGRREAIADAFARALSDATNEPGVAKTCEIIAGEHRARRTFLEISSACGSEVEAMLLAAIVFVLTANGTSRLFGLGAAEPRDDGEIGRIFVQAPIGSYYPYKADILIDCHFNDCYEPLRLVVECDGPWHDKWDQYHNDRVRDRRMQNKGYRVLRFPTSEIARRGAWKCAYEVADAIADYLRHEQEEVAERLKRMTNRVSRF